MQNKHQKSESGIACVIIVLVVCVLLALAAFFYVGNNIDKINENKESLKSPQAPVVVGQVGDLPGAEGGSNFEIIEENESTPDEIGNDVMEELDSLMDSIGDEDEDLSDLEM